MTRNETSVRAAYFAAAVLYFATGQHGQGIDHFARYIARVRQIAKSGFDNETDAALAYEETRKAAEALDLIPPWD